jgi:rSAM/selenodomain-associated transferase 2
VRLTVIIPTLNEERIIGNAIANVRGTLPGSQILVADAGSSDGTLRSSTGADRRLTAPRGRARQMNAGARHAEGDVLLLLHADSTLPPTAAEDIARAVAAGYEAGTFRLRFDRSSPVLDFYAACTALPVPSIVFGDRALFVRADTFETVGGYADVSIFEDLDLVRRLARRGRFAFLPTEVTTSARRFEQRGAVRQQLLNVALWLGFMAGIPPHRLARFYAYPDKVNP